MGEIVEIFYPWNKDKYCLCSFSRLPFLDIVLRSLYISTIHQTRSLATCQYALVTLAVLQHQIRTNNSNTYFHTIPFSVCTYLNSGFFAWQLCTRFDGSRRKKLRHANTRKCHHITRWQSTNPNKTWWLYHSLPSFQHHAYSVASSHVQPDHCQLQNQGFPIILSITTTMFFPDMITEHTFTSLCF